MIPRSLGFLLLLAAGLAGAAAATTYIVRPDGSGDFPDIQQAILESTNGDVIELADGTFTGPGNRDIDFAGRAVTVRAQGGAADSCVIDCQGGPGVDHRAFVFDSGEGPVSTLENLTILRGYENQSISYPYSHGGAILCDGASPTIRGCVFRDNLAQRGGAIYSMDASGLTILDCHFTGNTGLTVAGGVVVDAGTATIERCVFTGNEAAGGGALDCDVDSHIVIRECTIAGNHATVWGGGFIAGRNVVDFERTILWGNCCDGLGNDGFLPVDAEITFTCCALDPSQVWGSIVLDGEQVAEDPLFCDPVSCSAAPIDKGNYRIASGSPCAAANSPCGMRIGALDEGCASTSVTDALPGRNRLGLRVTNPATDRLRFSLRPPKPLEGLESPGTNGGRSGGTVRIAVIDVRGRVARTWSAQAPGAGDREFDLDLRGQGGRPLSSGVYYLRVEWAGIREIRSFVVAR
jgi:hypothetical protein